LLERHPKWAGDALPWLRQQASIEPAEAGQIAATENLFIAFQTDTSVRNLISELLDPAAATPNRTRAFLLKLLPALAARRPEPAWLRAIPPALTNAALRAAALNAATAYPQPEWAGPLARISEDAAVPPAERFLAARISARQPALGDRLFALALSALAPKANATDRLGAMDLLVRARFSSAQLRLLVSSWQRGVPVALEAMLPALARAVDQETRPLLAEFFITRLKSGWSPARAALDQVLAIFPDDAATRAALSAAWEQNNAGMRQRLSEFEPLLAGGDPTRGREWFNLATCAGCHRIGEHGGVVGPDLTRIGAIRSGGDLLESILFPSSSFAQGYEPYLLTRRDGEELSGNLVSQGPESVSLRDGIGVIHRVRSDDVASLNRQQLSAMPEGLEQLLTREQFRDLLAYLQSLK
jgi:putative heme-binding domain-containing protein